MAVGGVLNSKPMPTRMPAARSFLPDEFHLNDEFDLVSNQAV